MIPRFEHLEWCDAADGYWLTLRDTPTRAVKYFIPSRRKTLPNGEMDPTYPVLSWH